MQEFTFEDMKQIKREQLGDQVPLELFQLFRDLRIGLPEIVHQEERLLRVAIEDCFCKGLPVMEEKLVCDLEGAIMEGALSRILERKVSVKEIRCNVNGDERCEYEIRLL
ncbi:V4R domain-containing protein [Cohnella fermenti]|uniref:4-vinyl reductase n=1 Tax=Cohnella fermenti TaxID=2565925 RepID=A0A4S4BMT5_9BACL|nr:4-vinyl reductase [Cohnella fermenti]THF76075.1 4-vinyl reductase [Cohnella fermenti]